MKNVSFAKDGYYLCDTSDYRIIDIKTYKNLIFIYIEHDLQEMIQKRRNM